MLETKAYRTSTEFFKSFLTEGRPDLQLATIDT